MVTKCTFLIIYIIVDVVSLIYIVSHLEWNKDKTFRQASNRLTLYKSNCTVRTDPFGFLSLTSRVWEWKYRMTRAHVKVKNTRRRRLLNLWKHFVKGELIRKWWVVLNFVPTLQARKWKEHSIPLIKLMVANAKVQGCFVIRMQKWRDQNWPRCSDRHNFGSIPLLARETLTIFYFWTNEKLSQLLTRMIWIALKSTLSFILCFFLAQRKTKLSTSTSL